MIKRRPRSRAGTNPQPAQRAVRHPTRSPGSTSGQLQEVLSLIRRRPGIRPSELNRLLNLEQSDAVRNTLIKRGLIRKEKDGSAMRYYPL